MKKIFGNISITFITFICQCNIQCSIFLLVESLLYHHCCFLNSDNFSSWTWTMFSFWQTVFSSKKMLCWALWLGLHTRDEQMESLYYSHQQWDSEGWCFSLPMNFYWLQILSSHSQTSILFGAETSLFSCLSVLASQQHSKRFPTWNKSWVDPWIHGHFYFFCCVNPEFSKQLMNRLNMLAYPAASSKRVLFFSVEKSKFKFVWQLSYHLSECQD